jgi:cell division initiation protein
MLKFSSDDIAQQTFERRFRGYDVDQVDEFLDTVARHWERLVSELKQTRRDLEQAEERIDEYREREQSLQDSLEMAKKVADEVKEKAERDAELTVADAELEAERILAKAEKQASKLREDIYQLKQQRVRYRAELKSLISGHLEMVEDIDTPDDLEPPEQEAVQVEDEDIESADEIDSNQAPTSPGRLETRH